MRMLLLIAGLLISSCGILEPEVHVGNLKSVELDNGNFACQASAASYAVGKAARDDEWNLLFSATVSNQGDSTQQTVSVEFIILELITQDEIERASIGFVRPWRVDEERTRIVVSNSVFSTSRMAEVGWSARLVIL